MLTLTDSAVQVIRTVTTRSEPETQPDTGLRIATPTGTDNDAGTLTLSVAEGPEAGDQVVEEEGARVYLESNAATLLDEMMLDAAVDEQGEVSFSLAEK